MTLRFKMQESRLSAVGAAAEELIAETFRLGGRLSAAGDVLVEDLGITSARWLVLAGIARESAPEPVARLARNLGLSRQNVQRIVNELVTDRLVRLEENPHHKRAKLVILTPRGRRVHDDAERRQTPWVNVLASGLTADQIDAASRVLRTLRTRLETADE
jgi:DNA-binding MarR family transcriptional regulator